MNERSPKRPARERASSHAAIAPGEPAVVLKAGKEKSLRRRHPWVYATAVSHVTGSPAGGATVAIRAADGAWLAWAAYSPASSIRARVWSFSERDSIDATWMRERVRAAVAARAELAASSTALRLVFGESDRLPGLIVDRYADQLVTQFQGAGVDAWRDALVEALIEATGCRDVFDRSDGATRAREGLPRSAACWLGPSRPRRSRSTSMGCVFSWTCGAATRPATTSTSATTGSLARRWRSSSPRNMATGRARLNCFCYTGGFSVAVMAGGASRRAFDRFVGRGTADGARARPDQRPGRERGHVGRRRCLRCPARPARRRARSST